MTAVPVSAEFVETANPRQLHDEADVEGGSFLETSDGWMFQAEVGDADRMRAAVDNHVPEPYPTDPNDDLRAAIEAARTIIELKDALLGKSRPATVVARRP